MTASHPQYFIVTDSISPHSNSQQLTVIHCDEPNTGFEPRLISAHFLPAALVGGYDTNKLSALSSHSTESYKRIEQIAKRAIRFKYESDSSYLFRQYLCYCCR